MKAITLLIVTLAGLQAWAGPYLSVSPGSFFFSAASPTSPPQFQFMNITNYGDAPIEDLWVQNNCFSQINVFGYCPSTLPSGGNCMLEVQFNPLTPGPVFCQIQVSAGVAGTAFVMVQGSVGN